MEVISTGAFKVRDGELITLNVTSSGTLFGVNFSLFGGGAPLTEGQPLQVRMDKSKATGNSVVPNATSTPLTLLFSFSGNSGGRYDWTVTGDPGGASFPDFVRQAGATPKATTYTFHIV